MSVSVETVDANARPLAFVVLHTNGVGQLRLFVNNGNDQLNAIGVLLCLHTHLVACLAVVSRVGEFEVIAALVKVDKRVWIDLLQFGSSRVTYVHLITSVHQCPLRAAVKPCGQCVRSNLKLIALYLNVTVSRTRFVCAFKLCAFEGSFNATTIF